MTLVPPPISRSQFRNRPVSKTAGFETGVVVRGLSLLESGASDRVADRTPQEPFCRTGEHDYEA